MTNLEKYQNAFIDVFSATKDQLNENFRMSNVETWDSVTQMSLISELEDAFDILIDTDDVFAIDSYTAGIDILKKYEVEL